MSVLPLYLDCTIRDGGYINNWEFPIPFVKALYRAVSKAGAGYYEAGFIDPSAKVGLPWTHLSAEILEELRGDTPNGAKISALINFGSVRLGDVPTRNSSTPDLLRIACHKEDAKSATQFAADLNAAGYETSVNYMGISNYSNRDILRLVDLINAFGDQVNFYYLADSFGSLMPKRTREIFTTLRFGTDARLGFHPHNNLQLAFANTLEAMEVGIDIVDGSVFGMGRGAGNLYTDAVIAYFEQAEPDRYRVEPILQFADLHMPQLRERWDWGYSLPQLLSGLLKCHPNFPTNLLQEKSYTADAIFSMLKTLRPDERGKLAKGRIEQLKAAYLHHRADTVQDHRPDVVEALKNRHDGKALIVCGGQSVEREQEKIADFIARENPLVVTVNSGRFEGGPHAVFFGNLRRFLQRGAGLPDEVLVILGLEIEKDLVGGHPNITQLRPDPAVITATGNHPFLPTNSGIEAALPFLSSRFSSITYCGLDGFSADDNYFYDESDPVIDPKELEKINRILKTEWCVLSEVSKKLGIELTMLTQPVIRL